MQRTAARCAYMHMHMHMHAYAADGGALRVHERAELPAARVGSRGGDLQIGWLRATAQQVRWLYLSWLYLLWLYLLWLRATAQQAEHPGNL